MKLLVVLTSVLAVALAQRPWYAGSSPVGYPGLASRFKDDSAPTTSRPLDNRFDGPTQKIPVHARGDADLINRVNQWPRENRPFWVLNADHIEAQRNTNPSGQRFNGNPQNGSPQNGNPQNGSPQNLPSRFGGQQENNNNNNNIYPDPKYYYSFGYDDFGNPVFYHY